MAKCRNEPFYLEWSHLPAHRRLLSRYPEVIKLKSTSSRAVIEALNAVFSKNGIPETMRSDNGPQFSAGEFAADCGFQHTTSSPQFLQSNGLAERTVWTIKKILKGNQDPYFAILTYRSTQMPWWGLSPAQLLMGRQLHRNLPQIPEQLKPIWPHLQGFRELDQEFKSHQKANFDKHHRVHSLPRSQTRQKFGSPRIEVSQLSAW